MLNGIVYWQLKYNKFPTVDNLTVKFRVVNNGKFYGHLEDTDNSAGA